MRLKKAKRLKGYKRLECGRCFRTIIVPDVERFRFYCPECLVQIHKYGRR